MGDIDNTVSDSAEVSADEQEPSDVPWEGPADGTWDGGDVGFMEPREGSISDYRVTLLGPPEFGPLALFTTTVTGVFHVERFEAKGAYDDGNVSNDVKFGFIPGNHHWERHQENYGMVTEIDCDSSRLAVGESTTCKVSFSAPVEEMQNFYWWVNGDRVAAWPGQTTGAGS